MDKSIRLKGISRIDSKHTHGWFVRIYMRNREVHSKLFSDRKYGGKEEALKLAIDYRDSYTVPEEKRPINKDIRYRTKQPKNNKTGVVGVCKTFERANGGKGKKIPCFGVSWVPVPGRPRNKKFCISRYNSEEEAFQAAVRFRKEKEAEIDQQEKQTRKRRNRKQKSQKKQEQRALAAFRKTLQEEQARKKEQEALAARQEELQAKQEALQKEIALLAAQQQALQAEQEALTGIPKISPNRQYPKNRSRPGRNVSTRY